MLGARQRAIRRAAAARGANKETNAKATRQAPKVTHVKANRQALKTGTGGHACKPAGPLVEEAARARGHRGGAPYGAKPRGPGEAGNLQARGAGTTKRPPSWRPPPRGPTGVDEAAFTSTMEDAADNDPPPLRQRTNDDANDDVKRGAKPRAAGKADEYGARRIRAATTPTTATTTPTTPLTRSRSQGRPTRRRGNAGLCDARTRGGRPQERDGNVTATALWRRDGKVTATAAMVGATAPRQHRRNCDTTVSGRRGH